MGNELHFRLTEPTAGDSCEMFEDQPDTHRDDEFEVTDLRPRRQSASSRARLPLLSTQTRQHLLLVLSLLLLIAVLVGNVLYRAGVVRGLSTTAVSSSVIIMPPAATPMAASTQEVAISLPPAPAGGMPPPTVAPNSSVAHAVGLAPAQCSPKSPLLTEDGNPAMGLAIGKAPVLLGGFSGPYATLPIGPAASANQSASGWDAPYTQYGWPAPIEPILHSGVSGPVTLSGWDLSTGYPLWFGLVVAGVWGAPQQISPTIRLDPADPAIPAGGSTGAENFWYGYAFLPGAGCYTLTGSWPGGSWQITVSAGALPAGS
jgi:hypothetical protein